MTTTTMNVMAMTTIPCTHFALRLPHPQTMCTDKNLHQQDVAEARFKEIQAAYQVLSDPSERAWYVSCWLVFAEMRRDNDLNRIAYRYDRHRESILRGWDPTASQFDGINLWEFFVSDCYDAFNDGERGFYTVYRKVFDTLAVEEEKYDEDKKRKANQLPSFGNSKSTYAQVSAFYNFWLNFSSSKSFAWKDQYRTMDAENRQIRRLMEKENKKERDKAKRAFVDLVRKFTEFVKKKDKRVIGHLKKQQEERAEKEKLRAEQLKLHQEEHLRNKEILRQAANEHMDSINWKDIDIEALGIDKKSAAQLIGGDRSSKSRARGEDGQDEGDQQEEEEEEEEEEVPEHYCVACKKRFKSDKQWQNHEKSKKHRDAVAALRAELVLDEEIEQFLHDTDLTEEANVNINVEGGDDANTNNDGNVQPEPTAVL
jgi:DnaJ family protein A protein 5